MGDIFERFRMPKTRGTVVKVEPGAEDMAPRKKQTKTDDDADRQKIIELINNAAMESDASELLNILTQIQERIVFKV